MNSKSDLKFVLRMVLRGGSYGVDSKISPSKLAMAISTCRALGYIEGLGKDLRVTKNGLDWLREESPDPAFPFLDFPRDYKVASRAEAGLMKLGQRDRQLIIERVRDWAAMSR